jgi:urease accessory protein
MSLKFSFKDDRFSLDRLNLPSRYYLFKEKENYIKLLNIGEGIFPKDRIKTNFKLDNSNLIITTESATKIYPSNSKFYSINSIDINLQNCSNLEFLNDELILYKDAKFIQTFRLNFDENSTFFYTDILSNGRSFEDFDFTNMKIKNSFYENNKCEYIEKFDIEGFMLKDYIKRKSSVENLFAKVYIKTLDNESFLEVLREEEFLTFTYSKSKKIIIGVLSGDNMAVLKQKVLKVWDTYRNNLQKKSFNMGKQ